MFDFIKFMIRNSNLIWGDEKRHPSQRRSREKGIKGNQIRRRNRVCQLANPDYFDLPLLRPYTVRRRLYQEVIFAAATQRNTLVVLPTGLGKTVIAVLLAAYRLEKEPDSKVVMLAPTRPLVGQHHKTFSQMMRVMPDRLQIITGETPAGRREHYWRESSILFMTPQTLRSDLERRRYDLSEVSLLIFDEAHRARGRYDYVAIADYYMRQREDPRILALTASPGNVRALCETLYIENIEVRTEHSPDIIPYVQPVGVEYVIVDLPEEFHQVKELLRQGIRDSLMPLVELGLIRPALMDLLGRRDLLRLRRQLARRVQSGEGVEEPRLYEGLLGTALALRLSHALEVLETQGAPQTLRYWLSLGSQAHHTRAPRNLRLLVSAPLYGDVKGLLETLVSQGEGHPKHGALARVLRQQLDRQPDSRILVFTRFRVSAALLTDFLNAQQDVRAARFVGQAHRPGDPGLSQRDQLACLNAFRRGTYNVLVATSVAEEGLDISECNLVVFYDCVPSAIRRIQRAGRTGRRSPGRLVVLITRGTRDESYHLASLRRQQAMRFTLLRQAQRLRHTSPRHRIGV